MKIVVLVKYVPEPSAAWKFAPDLTLDRAAVEGRLSELDEYAVEQAVRLVEVGADATSTNHTVGPARAVDGLRKALAIGGTDAVHVVDDAIHGSGAVGTSRVLAAALSKIAVSYTHLDVDKRQVLRSPAVRASNRTVRLDRQVPTPTTMRKIVKISPAVVRWRTSRKPTVAMVVTVWYTASIKVKPRKR